MGSAPGHSEISKVRFWENTVVFGKLLSQAERRNQKDKLQGQMYQEICQS